MRSGRRVTVWIVLREWLDNIVLGRGSKVVHLDILTRATSDGGGQKQKGNYQLSVVVSSGFNSDRSSRIG